MKRRHLVVARNVAREQGIEQYQKILEPERQKYAPDVDDSLYEEISSSLLTALMVSMGYRIPESGLYRLADYSRLCDWLGEKEEDGKQRWEEG